MILMRIKRSRIGFEIRTFQGVNCHHDEVDFFRAASAGSKKPRQAFARDRRCPSTGGRQGVRG